MVLVLVLVLVLVPVIGVCEYVVCVRPCSTCVTCYGSHNRRNDGDGREDCVDAY